MLVVAGAFGVDTNVYLAGGPVGSEVTFARTTDGLGQAGCYSVLVARALGIRTRAIAALGDDRPGAWVRDELAAHDVELLELRDPLGTHRSVNLVAADGTRRNYFDARGASDVVVDVNGCRRLMRGARVLHCHLDDWCRRILPLAQAEGLLVSIDLQDVVALDDPYRAAFIAAADVLFLSAVNLSDAHAAAIDLARQRDGRVVVVGAGADGCHVVEGGRWAAYPAIDLPGPVIDTNGAGDALAVGFLVARVIDGLPLERAVLRAQLGARWICTQAGDAKRPLARVALDALERTVQPSE